MKKINISIYAILVALTAFGLQACKSKKMALSPGSQVQVEEREPVREPEPEPVEEEPAAPAPEPVVEEPNYNFRNIQFEYDSGVLKTDSYDVLDQIVREMKKTENANFVIDGHSSVEGSAAYNMELSIDRANAVKVYIVNAGIASNRLTTKGFGATKPAASNDSESGRAQNRRVEIRLVK